MLEKKREYRFEEVIDALRVKYFEEGKDGLYKDNNWCLYSETENMELNSVCYIDEYPECDDETYEEKMPEFIEEKKLQLIFRDELLQDVVISVLTKKESASNSELLRSIKFYDDNDTFLEL